MKEGIWVEDEQGNQIYMPYDEIDPEILPKLFKPIGGFCYPADGFMRLNLSPVPFYIKDWLPKPGKAIIYAPAKAGKSYLTYQMARCIGSGGAFLEIPTTQGRVLILQFELGASILQMRLRQTGQSYDNVFVGTTFAMKLDTVAGQEQLVKALDAIKPDVVVLDPLAKLLTGDENESHDVRPILDFIDQAMEAFDCSFVVFHHAGKDLGRGGRGTSILQDWPDSYIEVKRTSRAGEPLKIKVTPKLLRHAELPPEPIEAELVGFEFERIGGTPSIAMKVREIMAGDKVAQIQEILHLGSRGAVYKAMNKLIRAGQVIQMKRGVYRWIGGDKLDTLVGDVV